jgi:hypothetical protein
MLRAYLRGYPGTCLEGLIKTKLQWLQDPSKVNEDNLSNVRREASRHFRNKKREYLKTKLMRLN